MPGILTPEKYSKSAPVGPVRDRKYYLGRHAALKTDRASWDGTWRDLSDVILPRKSRFLTTDRNRGTKRNQRIINGTATRALRVLVSGMSSGITSPARPWKKLILSQKAIADSWAVRTWLAGVDAWMDETFQRSNLYDSLPEIYEQIGCFGTAAALCDEDDETTIRVPVLPIGSYALACDAKQRVNTLYREAALTVWQITERFGLDTASSQVKNLAAEGRWDSSVNLLNVIEPWPGGPFAWKDCWFECGGQENLELARGGYHEFPVLAPRWSARNEDVYGVSPGMEALEDILALQAMERRKSQALEKIVNPPMNAPVSMKDLHAVGIIPGHVNWIPTSGERVEPTQILDPRVLAIGEEIARHEQRIGAAFFADLFLAMTADPTGSRTAREIEERHQEKMLQIGPVFERLQHDLFAPLIARTFAIGWRRGEIEDPPDELEGQEWGVEYLSIVAQAQKAVSALSVEGSWGFTSMVAGLDPGVVDNWDTDRVVQDHARMRGVPPDMLRPAEQVATIRKQREMQQRMQAMAAAAKPMADASGALKNLSQTDMGNQDSALAGLSRMAPPQLGAA